jgi:iron(III) transport system permease protein
VSQVSSWLVKGPLLVALTLLVGWPLLATTLEASQGPRIVERALRSLGLDDWAGSVRSLWGSQPEPPTGKVLDPAAAAQGLQDTGRLARPARLAIQTLALVLVTLALVLPPGIVLALFLFRTDVWGRRLLLGVLGIAAFVPLPLHAPPQLLMIQPTAGVALKVTPVPLA